MRSCLLAFMLAVVLPAFGQTTTSLPVEFRISGRAVNSQTGNPVAGVSVAIGWATETDPLQSTATGADGRFVFSGVKPGKYWLMAEGRGFRRQGFQEHEGYFTGIAVGAGLKSEDLDFRLLPDASVEGVVSDEANDPVPDAQVMAYRTAVEGGKRVTVLEEQSTTDDTGRYRVSHLPPGSYYLVAIARPWYAAGPTFSAGVAELRQRPEVGLTAPPPELQTPHSPLDVAYPTQFYPGATDPNSASTVNLKPGDHLGADFDLAAVPAVRVHLHAPASEQGPYGAGLELRFGDTSIPIPFQQSTLQSGHSSEEVLLSGIAPGHYILTVHSVGVHPASWTQSIDIPSDMDLTLQAQQVVSVSGLVKLSGSVPISAHPALRLRSPTGEEEYATQITEKGQFDFREQAVRPGTYEVSILNLPNVAVTGLAANGAKVIGDRVTFAGTAAVQLEVIASSSAAEVQGTALRDGSPVSGAMIVLLPDDFQHHEQLLRRDQSDSDGTFSLRNVLPGKYTVLAIENGWGLEWRKAGVLDPYLGHGSPIEVGGEGRYSVNPQVQ